MICIRPDPARYPLYLPRRCCRRGWRWLWPARGWTPSPRSPWPPPTPRAARTLWIETSTSRTQNNFSKISKYQENIWNFVESFRETELGSWSRVAACWWWCPAGRWRRWCRCRRWCTCTRRRRSGSSRCPWPRPGGVIYYNLSILILSSDSHKIIYF